MSPLRCGVLSRPSPKWPPGTRCAIPIIVVGWLDTSPQREQGKASFSGAAGRSIPGGSAMVRLLLAIVGLACLCGLGTEGLSAQVQPEDYTKADLEKLGIKPVPPEKDAK